MKSTVVYKLLREEIGSWAKAEGFKRAKTMLSWYRPYKEMHIVFWFQISRDGWDEYAGSSFTFEFQLSREPDVGVLSVRRERLGKLLDDSAREELRKIQNNVIQSLPKPPSDYYILHLPEDSKRWYQKKFQTITEPFPQNYDIWLRYHTSFHVSEWGQFVCKHIPQCIRSVQEWS